MRMTLDGTDTNDGSLTKNTLNHLAMRFGHDMIFWVQTDDVLSEDKVES